ncbi:ThiF family protein [Ancylostoma ceylanicum]|uniref:NEDD8-activating enzyme E1 catalytic subunit n=1 Tax=Ancylostoma ceylanicum TaxID=53326 RepID=A0A0D6MAH1_9BILA|nr:ThiF family protein [Ancylostoma ceylanicum]
MADSVCSDPLAGDRWRDIRRLTDRPSGYAVPWFEPGPDNMTALQKTRVLVVGAGGLGCELLKNLALSGFQNLDVIDMDTIDISNLNRQFLFSHNCRIEDKPPSFYRQFSLVICGLDSIAARRWINGMLCDLVITENGQVDTSTVIPLIDGGTEGFKGSARVIYPKMSACIDCTLDLFPPQVNFPLCTIAHTPRLPEHCVEYVKVLQWVEEAPFNGASLDADDPSHVEWVLNKALARAEKYGIKGVDRRLTQGVLKRIIPAVASTNAVIAASCALEAVKLATNTAKPIDNYLNFTDIEGVYCGVVQMERDVSYIQENMVVIPEKRYMFHIQPECATCSGGYVQVQCDNDDTLQRPLERKIKEAKGMKKNKTEINNRDELLEAPNFIPSSSERQRRCDVPTRRRLHYYNPLNTLMILELKDLKKELSKNSSLTEYKFVPSFINQLKNPSLETATDKIYMINELIPELKEKSVLNLERPLRELVSADEDVLVADEVLSKSLSIRVTYMRTFNS